MNYSNIVKNANPEAAAGGYKNVFLFARRDNFLSLKRPVPSSTPGSSVLIATAHTFNPPAGFISWACKQHSVTLKGAPVGDDGARQTEWTATFAVLGDSASTQEQMEATLNDDIICLIKESACLITDAYVQLGDECVTPTFSVEFDSANTKEGMKTYNVTVVCRKKFFYTGAVTMATPPEEEE